MKIDHEEIVRRARQAIMQPWHEQFGVAAAIEQAVKETAEQAALIVEDADVEEMGRGHMRCDDGRATLYAAAKEIRSAFGIQQEPNAQGGQS